MPICSFRTLLGGIVQLLEKTLALGTWKVELNNIQSVITLLLFETNCSVLILLGFKFEDLRIAGEMKTTRTLYRCISWTAYISIIITYLTVI